MVKTANPQLEILRINSLISPSFRNKMSLFSKFLMLFAFLAGCKFPGVYKTEVKQGNQVELENLKELKVGMSKEQVRFLLGTPLIRDSFNSTKWIYLGQTRFDNELLDNKRIILEFKDDKLITIEHEAAVTPLDQPKEGDKSLFADQEKLRWWQDL